MTQQDPEYLGYYPDAELVFAIVCPLGTPYTRVVEALSNYLGHFGYKTKKIRISDYFDDLLLQLDSNLMPERNDAIAVAYHKIAAGNKIREITKKNDIMALVAAGAIADLRYQENKALGRKPNKRRTIIPHSSSRRCVGLKKLLLCVGFMAGDFFLSE
jgi:hypothetical protein